MREGGFGLVIADDGALVFTDPEGRRLQGARKPEAICFRGNNLELLNDQRGIEVSRPPGWHGERLDYGLAAEALLWERRVGRA